MGRTVHSVAIFPVHCEGVGTRMLRLDRAHRRPGPCRRTDLSPARSHDRHPPASARRSAGSSPRGCGLVRGHRTDRTTPSSASSLLDLSWRHLMLGASARLRRRVRLALARRGRIPGLRTAKATLAVVAAYLLAEVLHLSEHPIVAPLIALLVVQLTLYKTLMHGLGRVGGVLAGVLVAVGVANVAGLTWWSLGAVVAGSLVVGRLLRLGPHLSEAPITAMLLLEVSAGGALALTRVTEALLGALVGITVSVLVPPPLYLQPAGEAISELAERMANFARDFADGLRGRWSRSAADHWLTQARGVRDEVLRADLTVARVEESARLHPHARRSRDAQPQLRSTLTGLERCHLTLRTLARAVLDRTYFMPLTEQSAAYTSEQRGALADLLTTAAAALDSIIPIATGTDADAARLCVEAHLAELDTQRHRLDNLLTVDPQTDHAAWKQHGALLASIDRLRVEIAPAARPPDEVTLPLIPATTRPPDTT